MTPLRFVGYCAAGVLFWVGVFLFLALLVAVVPGP